MISVEEARKLIVKHSNVSRVISLPLLQANGSILAQDVFSKIDTPPFNQSAMDGYAFSYANWDKKSALNVVGQIQAGNFYSGCLSANEAIRVFTGSLVPDGTDTVVMQEKIRKDGNAIHILDDQLFTGNNVRLQDSQTKKGAIALVKGQLLTPVGVSFLAGIGIREVEVYAKPTVSIIITGKELVQAGGNISDGKIFESNSIGLVAALHQLGISPESVEWVDDDVAEIEEAIAKQLSSDILIITGGVSVGDYDLVPASLEKCGVEKVFHKIKQKPGKPMFFGTHNQKIVFGLPGNPASVMSCVYNYVLLAISSFTRKNYLKTLLLPLANDYFKKANLTFFLKGIASEHEVSVLDGQESYLLNSFAVANCLLELEAEKLDFKKGTVVKVLMIA